MAVRFDDLPGEVQGGQRQSPRFEELPGKPVESAAGAGGTAAESLANMLSLVGVPNVFGAQDALHHLGEGSFVENFKKARAVHAAEQKANFAAHPAAALGGALGTLLVGGNPSDVGKLAVTAAAQAGLSSDELASGDVAGAMKEAGKGGAIAGLGGLALEGAGAGLSTIARSGPLAKTLARLQGVVRGQQLEQLAKAAQGELRSGISALGGESSTLMRLLDRAEEMLTNPAATAEQRRAAAKWLSSPEGVMAKQISYANVLEQLPGATERVSNARTALDPLRAATSPEALQKATDEAMASPVKTQILPRAKVYLQRAIPAAIGAKIGGPGGALAGAGIGAIIGKPTTAISNMFKAPSVRALGLNAAKAAGVTAPGFLGDLMPLIGQALLRSPELLGQGGDQAPAGAGPSDEDRAIALAGELKKPITQSDRTNADMAATSNVVRPKKKASAGGR